jgi:outer membrane lipoprotein
MKQGIIAEDLSKIKQAPSTHTGQLYIIGGIIVKTTLEQEGSHIEAVFIPVDSRGYLKSFDPANGRFFAVYRSTGMLDPLIYSEKREITLAGEFIEMRGGKIGEMGYSFPFFEIKEIYLWKEIRERDYYYYAPPPYPYYYPYYYRHRMYDPWWYY